MIGMIFAAGYGSRLKPWTDSHPKALVEVGGRPMLARVIDKLRAAGIGRIIVNTHHFADQIHEFLDNGDYLDYVTVSHEPDLLDTGGGLAKVISMLGDEPVLLHNADILTDFDLRAMARAHAASGADATLLTAVRPTRRFLTFGPDGRMNGSVTAETRVSPETFGFDPADKTALAFGGVHIISPSLYPILSEIAASQPKFSISTFYKERFADFDLRSWLMPDGAYWFDVGNPETLAQARQFIANS